MSTAIEHADKLFADGSEAQALELLEYAYAENQQDHEIGIALSTAYFRQDRYDDSERILKQIISHKPDNAIALNNIGYLYLSQGRAVEAGEFYKQALTICNDDPEIHLNYGMVFAYLDQYDNAILHFEKSLHLSSESPAALNNIGVVLKKLGKLEESAEYFLRAIKTGDATAHNNLGCLERDRGNIGLALEHFRKAVDIDGSPVASKNLAVSLYENGNKEKSKQIFSQLAEISEGSLVAEEARQWLATNF